MKPLLLAVPLIFLSSCATRTIYVPSGTPVKLAAPVKDHPIWLTLPDGSIQKTRLTIPEGWWALEDTRP